ncbi:hypothetical protein DTL70_11395 [Streptomyces diacarni]|uniref:DUF7144 domain-containing protein n=1 Tax=Streptomyces diacarni TaxID=2800381 RepID=A0A367F5U8_9ACTN|nr:hypothetical protein [Streptomyces diacarni]RCG24910.1 hypothetical protein DTL70_11395 [Streptomyces diacarni]
MAQPTAPGPAPQGSSGDSSHTRAWAVGGTVFAGVVLVVNGLLDILKGITAVASDQIYTGIDDYVFRFNLTAWGWALLAVGVVALAAGLGLLADALWARIVGVTMASLSLLANFLWLPYQPLWAVVSIGLGAWVIWALTANRSVGSSSL